MKTIKIYSYYGSSQINSASYKNYLNFITSYCSEFDAWSNFLWDNQLGTCYKDFFYALIDWSHTGKYIDVIAHDSWNVEDFKELNRQYRGLTNLLVFEKVNIIHTNELKEAEEFGKLQSFGIDPNDKNRGFITLPIHL